MQTNLTEDKAAGAQATAAEKDLPEFRPIRLEDKAWIDPALKEEDSMASLGCFGTHYLWGPAYGQTIAFWQGKLLARYGCHKGLGFAFPMGPGPVKPAVLALEELAAAQGCPLVMRGITQKQREKLESEMPGYFTFSENRQNWDYIYEVEKLAGLSGKKLQAKRNHCNRFERENPGWHFEELREEDVPACLALLNRWTEERADEREADELLAEKQAIEKAFAHYTALGLVGGGLFVGEELVAFTLGEECGENAFDVRFEKADPNREGAFAMVNREFARLIQKKLPHIKYLNREEDLGLEALRKAKLSYRPAFMLEKFNACGPDAGKVC